MNTTKPKALLTVVKEINDIFRNREEKAKAAKDSIDKEAREALVSLLVDHPLETIGDSPALQVSKSTLYRLKRDQQNQTKTKTNERTRRSNSSK